MPADAAHIAGSAALPQQPRKLQTNGSEMRGGTDPKTL
jgi:hypothetical protein